jgi:hypothetical protein
VSDLFALYEIFNRIECLAWWGVAVALPFVVKTNSVRQKCAVFGASLGFILFGISDYFEAPMHGHLPLWLWIWKILCASLLLACRYHYVGWRNFRLTDRYFIFGLIALAASLGIIGLQQYIEKN